MWRVGAAREASLTDRVIAQVTAWPAVSASRATCGRGVALSVNSHQIVHLHDPTPAQVRLTRPVIQRMAEALQASGRVEMAPEDDWVSLTLDSDGDVALLVSLVSVAIKAHAAQPPGVSHRDPAPCAAGRRWRRR
jgi:hypothetical protein